jgi:hypothetical protein
MCFESHVFDVAFSSQPIWNFVRNRLVEEHIRGNAQATERGTLDTDISLCSTPILA